MTRPKRGPPPPKRDSRPVWGTEAANLENLNNSNGNPGAIEQGRQVPVEGVPVFRLVAWCPFFWRVLGNARIASNDLIADVEICEIAGEVFALGRRPAGFSDAEWSAMLDTAVMLVREAYPEAFAGTIDLFGKAAE